MTEEKTAMQKTAARLGALFERHEPEPEHDCPTCGKTHSSSSRTAPWYSFTTEAIQNKGDDYAVLSTLIHDDAPDTEAGYEWLADVLAAIEEGSITDEDDISEWADSSTPVYTSELLGWMAEGTCRQSLIEEMLYEYGGKQDGADLNMQAYCYGLDRFARQVWHAVEQLAEDGEEASE